MDALYPKKKFKEDTRYPKKTEARQDVQRRKVMKELGNNCPNCQSETLVFDVDTKTEYCTVCFWEEGR